MSIKDLKQGDIVYFGNYAGICYFPSNKILCKEGYMPIDLFFNNFECKIDVYYNITHVYRTFEPVCWSEVRINGTYINLSKEELKEFQKLYHYFQIFPSAHFIKL